MVDTISSNSVFQDVVMLQILQGYRPSGPLKHFEMAGLISKIYKHPELREWIKSGIITRHSLWGFLSKLYNLPLLNNLYYSQLEEDGVPDAGYQFRVKLESAPLTPNLNTRLKASSAQKNLSSINPGLYSSFVEFNLNSTSLEGYFMDNVDIEKNQDLDQEPPSTAPSNIISPTKPSSKPPLSKSAPSKSKSSSKTSKSQPPKKPSIESRHVKHEISPVDNVPATPSKRKRNEPSSSKK